MDAYEKDVWNFAFSLMRRQDLADDITQDVFVKVFQKMDTFRGESSVKTWLFSITRNVAMDYKRSAFFRKVTVVESTTGNGSYQSAENDTFEDLVEQDVWKAVLNLPMKLRQVMVLSAHHHLSYSEIAEVLGISESAVKTRLHRARQKALQNLSEEGGQDEKLEFDWNKNLSAPPVTRRKTSSEEIRKRVHERIGQKTKPYKTIGTLLGRLVAAAVALWFFLPTTGGLFSDNTAHHTGRLKSLTVSPFWINFYRCQ